MLLRECYLHDQQGFIRKRKLKIASMVKRVGYMALKKKERKTTDSLKL